MTAWQGNMCLVLPAAARTANHDPKPTHNDSVYVHHASVVAVWLLLG
jgi:hypothetical protein